MGKKVIKFKLYDYFCKALLFRFNLLELYYLICLNMQYVKHYYAKGYIKMFYLNI